MHVVLGATGHVGGAVAEALLKSGEPVTAVVRDAAKGEKLRAKGAELAVADIHDIESLRAALRRGRRAFLLNPPAAPSTDTDAEEARTIRSIVDALDGSGLEKVVALSVYGARAGHRIGDLGTLHRLEEGLKRQPIPATILRATYYMSNWNASLETAKAEGVVHTLFPVDFRLAMVAPADLGEAAARLMMEPAEQTGVHFVEGPERYTSADVATAFAEALGREVKAVATPRSEWQAAFRSMGFSDAAAESYAGMTALAVDTQPPPLKRSSVAKARFATTSKALSSPESGAPSDLARAMGKPVRLRGDDHRQKDGRVEATFRTALEDSGFFGQDVPLLGVCRGNCISFASAGTGPAGDMVVAYTGLLRDGRKETLWYFAADAALSAAEPGAPAEIKPLGWWKAVTANADTFERRD